jgi:DNA-binding MarR family transcriptional regulator
LEKDIVSAHTEDPESSAHDPFRGLSHKQGDLVDAGLPEHRYDLQILQSLRRIIRATDLYSRRLKLKYNITAPQLICLLAITDHGTITVSELARTVHLSASTVVGILNRLEQKELIVRMRNTRDRRIVFVSATDDGVKLVRNAPTPLQDNLSEALQNLSEDDQASIADSLNRLVSMMEIEEIEVAPILTGGLIQESNPDKQNDEQEKAPGIRGNKKNRNDH